jgi:hypothetical protein
MQALPTPTAKREISRMNTASRRDDDPEILCLHVIFAAIELLMADQV